LRDGHEFGHHGIGWIFAAEEAQELLRRRVAGGRRIRRLRPIPNRFRPGNP
jgi:hypothetical protein